MSLKNDVKVEEFVYQLEKHGRVITVVGNLLQTCMKKQTMLANVTTTPGGDVLDVQPLYSVDDNFDAQHGIRKEFYMGWSICCPEDIENYDYEYAKELARKRFTRPLVTYNFTYLNKDMINVLLKNEAEYIADNLTKYISINLDDVHVSDYIPQNHDRIRRDGRNQDDVVAASKASAKAACNMPVNNGPFYFANGMQVTPEEFTNECKKLMENPFFRTLFEMTKFM